MLILCPHWIFYTFMNTLMYVMYINPMKFNVSMFQRRLNSAEVTSETDEMILFFDAYKEYKYFDFFHKITFQNSIAYLKTFQRFTFPGKRRETDQSRMCGEESETD